MRPARSRPDDVTEQIRSVAPDDTKELPVVGPEPLPHPQPHPQSGPPAGAPPVAPPAAPPVAPPAAPPVAPPAVPPVAPSAAPPVAPPAAPPQAVPPAARPGPTSRGRILLAAGLAALAIGAGAAAGTMLSGRGGTQAAVPSSAAPSAAAPIDATVSSLDPSGGSGFARRGDDWRTQTYRTAAFGGLKPGVGLVLDLGSPRAVTSVTFEARTAGSTVSLRAADDAPTTDAGLAPVGTQVEASGRTVLDGSSGGAHRYWVVWVSELGPRGDGFGATFGTPQVTGPSPG